MAQSKPRMPIRGARTRHVRPHAPENGGLRHRAASRWFHEELDEPGRSSPYLGANLATVLNHYVRGGEDALRDSVSKPADR